ncbi:hypothetical protein [Croceicoccus gelatinilyticus]|uniref:hypothetical protein n=1 Tax=Croceicoccus gelatinilyticus TaxID=2835536 RepID=UPI001BCE366F|nr:hypothetical protein [Croceicoccus gelatinilyticus]MBS7670910.1 hypothetical protein [Croceicoccus gelatinilyticus]
MIARLAVLYLLVGLLACAAPWFDQAFAFGLSGLLRSTFAMLLSLPWSLLVPYVPDGQVILVTLLCVMGILINYGALRWLAARAA